MIIKQSKMQRIKNNYIRIILTIWIQSAILWVVVYFISVFIIWGFYDPFFWIRNIPNEHPDTRGFYLFTLTLYYLVSCVIWKSHYKPKDTKEVFCPNCQDYFDVPHSMKVI